MLKTTQEHISFNPKAYWERLTRRKQARLQTTVDGVITSAPMTIFCEMHKRKFNQNKPETEIVNCHAHPDPNHPRRTRKNGDVTTEQRIRTNDADEAALVCLERKNDSGACTLLHEDIPCPREHPLLQEKILQSGDTPWYRDNQIYIYNCHAIQHRLYGLENNFWSSNSINLHVIHITRHQLNFSNAGSIVCVILPSIPS